MNTNFNSLRELTQRMTRIESKLVRGFEELGVNIDADPNWLSVDESTRTVYVSTMGRSLTVIRSDMLRAGAKQTGKFYTLVHQGEEVGTLLLEPVS